mmetsp:Transcript_52396/g.111328  ORF Transcript_52396/g.111328 Transcript_52396/m.111328 type:complete len:83 (+) Transcript_52396:955-1203(+)
MAACMALLRERTLLSTDELPMNPGASSLPRLRVPFKKGTIQSAWRTKCDGGSCGGANAMEQWIAATARQMERIISVPLLSVV